MLGVAPERLDRWLDGVAARHGSFTDVRVDDAGAVHVDLPGHHHPGADRALRLDAGAAALTAFAAAVRAPQRTAVLLVRRGRWAVGVFDGAELVVSKVDSRQVQGRTAAGGWSQQRFARRRGNQTDAVVSFDRRHRRPGAAAARGTVEALATGGDKGLVAEVLADPRLRPLAALPRLGPLDVGEPTKAVLLQTPAQFRAVRVHIVEPGDRS